MFTLPMVLNSARLQMEAVSGWNTTFGRGCHRRSPPLAKQKKIDRRVLRPSRGRASRRGFLEPLGAAEVDGVGEAGDCSRSTVRPSSTQGVPGTLCRLGRRPLIRQ